MGSIWFCSAGAVPYVPPRAIGGAAVEGPQRSQALSRVHWRVVIYFVTVAKSLANTWAKSSALVFEYLADPGCGPASPTASLPAKLSSARSYRPIREIAGALGRHFGA